MGNLRDESNKTKKNRRGDGKLVARARKINRSATQGALRIPETGEPARGEDERQKIKKRDGGMESFDVILCVYVCKTFEIFSRLCKSLCPSVGG